MKKLSSLLLLFAASVALGGQGMGPGPGVKGYSGGGGGLTVQVAQAITASSQARGTATTLTLTLASNPLQNELVYCAFGASDTDGAGAVALASMSMSDNFGDAGSWTAASLNPVTTSTDSRTGWVFYKTLSANASNKIITATTNTQTPAGQLACGVLKVASGTPTWAVDGTPVSAVGTTPGGGSTITTGTITTTNTSTFVLGFSGDAGAAFTAGSGFTVITTTSDGLWNWVMQDYIASASGSQTVSFADPTYGPQPYLTLGIAFKAN